MEEAFASTIWDLLEKTPDALKFNLLTCMPRIQECSDDCKNIWRSSQKKRVYIVLTKSLDNSPAPC